VANTLYDVGDVIRCTGTFADEDGVAVDPGALTAKYKKPDNTTVTLVYGVDGALVKLSTGIYYFDVDATMAGVWWYRFAATGSGKSADEKQFRVEASQF
jgi:hypothetical protein